MSDNKIVVVLGMARSGTSLLAKMLHYSGVFMGECTGHKGKKNNWLHDIDNPEYPQYPLLDQVNHYEDYEIAKINHNIYWAAFGAYWQIYKNNIALFYREGFKEEHQKAIKAYIKKRNIQYNIWGWKDPRQLTTLSFFIDHLITLNTYYVMIHRHPLHAALSARKRDNVETTRWMWIYGQYLSIGADILWHMHSNIIHISYEGLLNKTEETFRKVCDFIGIEFKDYILNIPIKVKNHWREATNDTSYPLKEIE